LTSNQNDNQNDNQIDNQIDNQNEIELLVGAAGAARAGRFFGGRYRRKIKR